MNLIARRRDTLNIINEDPWSVTVYRRRATGDADEVTFTLSGRVSPAGARGAPSMTSTRAFPGTLPVGRFGWLLLTEYDVDRIIARDEIIAVQDSTSITRKFLAVYSARYSYKYEVIMDERQ